MESTIVGKHKFWKKLWLSTLLLQGQSAQTVVHGSVKAFTLAVPLWMIGGYSTLSSVTDLTQLTNHLALEIPPLVAVDPLRYTKPYNPFLH